MKPYGKKQEKSKHHYKCSNSECVICNNNNWKISKTRERRDDEAVEDYRINKDTVIDFCELEYTVRVRAEEDGIFHSLSNVIDIESMAIDPDEALERVAHKFYKQNQP